MKTNELPPPPDLSKIVPDGWEQVKTGTDKPGDAYLVAAANGQWRLVTNESGGDRASDFFFLIRRKPAAELEGRIEYLPPSFGTDNKPTAVEERMTLRDSFAMAALAGQNCGPVSRFSATLCYEMADAMIEARKAVKS